MIQFPLMLTKRCLSELMSGTMRRKYPPPYHWRKRVCAIFCTRPSHRKTAFSRQ